VTQFAPLIRTPGEEAAITNSAAATTTTAAAAAAAATDATQSTYSTQ
jgi:hypothetical protein